jgi:DNA primase
VIPTGRIPASLIAEVRARTSLVDLIGARVPLRKDGRGHVGQCPFHHDKTPSFKVTEAKGFFHCFGCHAHGDAIDFVMRLDGLPFADAVEDLASRAGLLPGRFGETRRVTPPPVVRRQSAEQIAKEIAEKIEWARRAWGRAVPVSGTLGETYLRNRGITDGLPPSIRFAPAQWHKDTQTYVPALVVAFQAIDGPLIAIHRTYLRPDGSDRDRERGKLAMGPYAGGAVRLNPPAARMLIGEGLESSLSARQATGIPTWAGLSTSGIRSMLLPPLPLASDVTIAADHDANGAGQKAARTAARRWMREGRQVRIALPPEPDTDFNTMLQPPQRVRAA